MALTDHHTHTWLCKHASGLPEEYMAEAIKAGLSGLGLADHFPWPADYDEKHRMAPEEFPTYKKMVETLRAKAPPGMDILFAAEADWVPGHMDECFDALEKEDFDYVIGSIHFVDDLPFDHPDHKAVWFTEGRPAFIWRRYYELMLDMVSSGKFDIVGHFDLPKKFGVRPPPEADTDSLVDEIIAVVADLGMAVEINTSGLRKPVGEMYPSIDVLTKIAKSGARVVLGSDAHAPREVAMSFAKAVDIAREAGFKHIHNKSGGKFVSGLIL